MKIKKMNIYLNVRNNENQSIKKSLLTKNQIIMKKVFTFIIIIIITCSVQAQDIMITKDGQKITAKVEEIGVELIKYKKHDNLNGVSYSIRKSEVSSILYENGDFDVFSQESQKGIYQPNKSLSYKNAKKLYNLGIGLSIGGSVVILGGVACYFLEKYDALGGTNFRPNEEAVADGGIAMMTVGSVATISGIICAIIGKSKMNSNGDISLFQTNNYKLDMAIGGNNLGIKFKF